MIRRPPRSTLFPLHDALPISSFPRRAFAPGLCLFASPAFAEASAEAGGAKRQSPRSEEHTSELQSQSKLVCPLLLEKKNEVYTHGGRPPGAPTPLDHRPAPAR